MFRILTIFWFFLVSTFGDNLSVPSLDGRIVGGINSTIQDSPHQISLRLDDSHVCGGSILTENMVLTAAHCTVDMPISLLSIEYGSSSIGDSNNVIAVKRIIRHPNYDTRSKDSDVALLELENSIAFSDSARPISLATETPAPGTAANVTGWGRLSEGGPLPSSLQLVEINIVSKPLCQQMYPKFNITENMLCAGVQDGGKDSCQGDSGGPLVANGFQVGVVSWGKGCARPNYPGVYADVANLRSWIEENLGSGEGEENNISTNVHSVN